MNETIDTSASPKVETSTTRVIVPSTTVVAPNGVPSSYTSWDGIVFVCGAVAMAIMGLKGLLEFVKTIVELIEKKKQKEKEADAPLLGRVVDLEETIKAFLPKDTIGEEIKEIYNRLDHDKNTNRMIQQGFEDRLRRQETTQAEHRAAVVRLETNVESLAMNAQRNEKSLESMRERMDAQFDRLHDAFLHNLSSSKPTT